MADYTEKLSKEDGVTVDTILYSPVGTNDVTSIPVDDSNPSYQKYLAWKNSGNVPDGPIA